MLSSDELRAKTGYVLILMYHAVVKKPLKVFDWCFIQENEFEAQVSYLKSRFDIVPLADIPTLLHEDVRRPTAAVTFDDGFLNNYDVAFPILRRLRIPATIFLCTDLIDTDEILWFCRLNRALGDTPLTSFEWNGERYDLGTADARAAASKRLQAQLKRGTPYDLSDHVKAIITSLGGGLSKRLETNSPYRMLTCAAIHQMEQSQLVEFGAHTKSHAILKRLSPHDRKDQIEGSITAVEKLTGRPCRLFAYPNGQRDDYDEGCVDLLAAVGVKAAVTAIAGLNDARTPPLELKRIGVGGDVGFEDFKAILEGKMKGDAVRPERAESRAADRAWSAAAGPDGAPSAHRSHAPGAPKQSP